MYFPMSRFAFRKPVWLAAAAAGMLALLAYPAVAASRVATTHASLTTLRIAYNPNATNTSIIVAQQQGYFKKYGLNVKLTASTATTNLLPALGKQFDLVGAGASGILQFASQGYKPILVSAETVENATTLRNTWLIGNKDITSISQLAGKTIGATSTTSTQWEGLLNMLRIVGISQSQVHFVQVPFADVQSDLQSGAIDAGIVISPFGPLLLKAGYNDLGDPAEAPVNNDLELSIGWVAYAPWAYSHEKVLKEFQEAQWAALHWMHTHDAQARQLLETQFQLSATAAAAYPLTKYVSFAVKQSYIRDWIAPLKAVGALPGNFNVPIKTLVYTP